MWTTISYKEAVEGEKFVRIYDDSTEKSFESYNDASTYGGYLLAKYGNNIDIYEKTTIPPGGLDIDELKKQDALAKLTEEERALLNIKP